MGRRSHAKRPIGLELVRSAKRVARAFNDALADAGGSLPTWLILSSLRGDEPSTQQQLARAVGIEGPTLTRHLDVLEEEGLVRRAPQPDDRRAMRVELTPAGEALFSRLLEVVIAFDRRLTAELDEGDLDTLRALLGRLEENVG